MSWRWPLKLTTLVLLGACAACSQPTVPSTKAPPTVICGTTLSDSAAGAYVQDASSGAATVSHVSVGGDIYLKLSANCHTGASVTIAPSSAASVVAQARADDGATAAIVLHPRITKFDIQVHRPSGTIDLIRVSLDGLG